MHTVALLLVAAQQFRADIPPGRLIDLGGYRLHLYCTGASAPGQPTIVLSAGGGDFFMDWSRVQAPLADSARVCSYDRPGYGFSDPGPEPRTFRQEAVDLHQALEKSGEHAPYVLVGHSLGAFVARVFAADYRAEVAGVVLVGAANENGKLGYHGQYVIPRTLASDRPVPPVHTFAESPPTRAPAAEVDSCRARAERNARIYRPYDQLRAPAQRYRMWAMEHPSCLVFQDDFFAEQMVVFYRQWSTDPHPLGDLPLTVIMGTGGPPPPVSAAELASDSLRIDLSKLSRRGRLVNDPTSGHHVQLDNPALVVRLIKEMVQPGAFIPK